MKKRILVLTFLLSLTAMAESTINDNKELLREISPSKNARIVSGYKTAREGVNTLFAYNEDAMYTIYCRVNYLTTIMLQPGEHILFVGGGDTARWRRANATTGSNEGEREVIYIKPSSINLKTNLVINTNKRNYQINLISHKSLYNPLIKWEYPQDEIMEKLEFAKQKAYLDSMQEAVTDPTEFDYNYSINTDKYDFAPEQVYSDPKKNKTYILFGNIQEMPSFYIIDGGKELLITNYRTKGHYLMIDRLFEKAELRVGKKVVKIRHKK